MSIIIPFVHRTTWITIAVWLFMAQGSAFAGHAFWDSVTGNSTPDGGSGNWNLFNDNWWRSGANSCWTDNSIAVFSNTAGTVSLQSDVMASGMVFTCANYVIEPGNYRIELDGSITGEPPLLLFSGAESGGLNFKADTAFNGKIKNGRPVMIVDGATLDFDGYCDVNDGMAKMYWKLKNGGRINF